MSLKKKLIIGVLVTSLAIISICSLFTFVAVNIFSKNSKELTQGLSEDVNRDVSGFANHYAGTLTYHENQNVDSEINTILDSGKRSILISSNFNEIYTTDGTAITNLFSKIVRDNPLIANLYIATTDGSIHGYPELKNLPADFNPVDRPWYGPAAKLKQKQFHISDSYVDAETNENVITISMPVYRNDVLYGVIGCDIKLTEFAQTISATKVGETGYVILTDRTGNLMAYKDQKLVDENSHISELSIFKDQKGDTTYLDTEQVSYIGSVHKETGWRYFSVVTQEEILSFSDTISTNMSTRINEAEEVSSSTFSKLFAIQVIIIIALILFSAGISFLFARKFVNPINKLSQFMKSVAQGDLTKTMPVHTKDEIGSLFTSVNSMILNFRDMVSKLHNLVKEVERDAIILNEQSANSSAITESVYSAMQQVSSGSEQLAEDMVNISHNVETNDDAVKRMSESIKKIVVHADETKSTSAEGKAAMENLNNKMKHITEQAGESSSIMKSLDIRLKTINDITTIIHGLAEQTNLLSLNASIEAARAGEQGRGFAVVAQEVKKLAEQSSDSVNEIASLIDEIQSASAQALSNIDKGKVYALEGAELSIETETSLLKIIDFINYLSKDIDEIAEASMLLDRSSGSISRSVDNVASISEETSAGVQEVASTTADQKQSIEELQEISNNLRKLTEELKESFESFQI